MHRYLDIVQQARDAHVVGDWKTAAHLYEHCLGSRPDDAVILYLYGTLCSQMKRYGTAIHLLRNAVQEAPALTEAWHNLGVAYRNEGHTEAARLCYQAVINEQPENADALAMMGGSYVNTGTPLAALHWCDQALRVDPKNPHARNHKALALLELGRYKEGWEYYSTRYEIAGPSMQPRPFECPRWNGEKVRKLAIHGEQGVGDEVMFMSCWPDLVNRVDEVVIECEPRLVSLFRRSFGSECYGTYEELIAAHPDCDAHIAMGDLPAFNRNKKGDFPGAPFLMADKAKVAEYRAWLESLGPGPYVGIAWHGGTKGTHQELRNPPMGLWAKLVAEGGTFVSLQYGEMALSGAVELGIWHRESVLESMDNFAALVKALDLVVTPCQTAVHIAGALGAPCWCLTPNKPAWRYGLTGERMDWYKSVKLYRQTDNWDEPFEKVMDDYRVLQRAESQAA